MAVCNWFGFVSGYVIQAIGTGEFEDGLKKRNQSGSEISFQRIHKYLRLVLRLIPGSGLVRFLYGLKLILLSSS